MKRFFPSLLQYTISCTFAFLLFFSFLFSVVATVHADGTPDCNVQISVQPTANGQPVCNQDNTAPVLITWHIGPAFTCRVWSTDNYGNVYDLSSDCDGIRQNLNVRLNGANGTRVYVSNGNNGWATNKPVCYNQPSNTINIPCPTPTPLPQIVRTNTSLWSSCLADKRSTGGADVVTIDCVPTLILTIITGFFMIAGTLAVIFIIFAGYKFITSGGDPKQVEAARKIITYAIIGLLIILSSYLIINVISTLTGVNCIKIVGFDQCK